MSALVLVPYVWMTVVLADTGVDPATHTGSDINTAQIISLLIGFVLPLVVGAVLKHEDSPTVKIFVNIVANLVNGFLVEWLNALHNNTHFVWQQALFGAILSFFAAMTALYGAWKPSGVDDKLKNRGLRRSSTRVAPRNQHGVTNQNMVLGIVLIVLGLVLWLVLGGLIGLILGIVLVIVGIVMLLR